MSTGIVISDGTVVNVAELRLAITRDVSKDDYRIDLYFKGIRDYYVTCFDNYDARDKVFQQIQNKMLGQD